MSDPLVAIWGILVFLLSLRYLRLNKIDYIATYHRIVLYDEITLKKGRQEEKLPFAMHIGDVTKSCEDILLFL